MKVTVYTVYCRSLVIGLHYETWSRLLYFGSDMFQSAATMHCCAEQSWVDCRSRLMGANSAIWVAMSTQFSILAIFWRIFHD